MGRIYFKKIFACILIFSLFFSSVGCGLIRTKSSDGLNFAQVNDRLDYRRENRRPDKNSDAEEYNITDENPFLSANINPLSTFGADVDTSSYSLIRKSINNGNTINPDSVRIEEMLNYFSYDYPEPTGDDPLSITTELSPCSWNDDTQLMLIGLKADEIKKSQIASNFVFLIDVSNSMFSSNKLPVVKQACSLLVENLTENDRISIVTYAGYNDVLLDGVTGDNKYRIQSTLEDMQENGSTNGSSGINTAYELAEKHFITNGNNRIILATDGDLNVGITSEWELKRLVEEKCQSGIYLSVLNFGSENSEDNKMQSLAANGNGNYSYIDSVGQARKVLLNESGATLSTVAKDVKIQVEFNPDKIKGYRLIGYESRSMNSTKFRNESKYSGDISSGHEVTALYEIVPKDSKLQLDDELKYQKENTINSDELLTISIRYKKPGSQTSTEFSKVVDESNFNQNLSDNMKFATAVIQVGMILRNSSYKGRAELENSLELLNNIPELKDDEYKNEFYQLVKKLIDMPNFK